MQQPRWGLSREEANLHECSLWQTVPGKTNMVAACRFEVLHGQRSSQGFCECVVTDDISDPRASCASFPNYY
jgi:hypothetical protein